MAIIQKTTGLTYEDYCELPDDRNRYEIIDGVLHVSPAPSEKHQRALGGLFEQVGPHVRRRRLGRVYVAPLDILLSVGNVVQPDLVFVGRERLSVLTAANVQGAPDLVVEVLSPSTRSFDLREKRDAFGRHGVRWYWVVDPLAETIEAYELLGEAYELVASASGSVGFSAGPFPDLTIDLALLWD